MKNILYALCALLLLLNACQNTNNKTSLKNEEVLLKFQNLPLDSCSIRIHHIITGEEVYSNRKINLKDQIVIPNIEDDVYIIVLSWPKTIITHQVYNSKNFDVELGEDIFELTKPWYIDHKNSKKYVFNLRDSISIEDLEISGASGLKFENEGCIECDLADEYWQLFNDFFDRKNEKVDSLKIKYYTSVDLNDDVEIKKSYEKLENFKTNFLKDDKLDADLIQKVSQNNASPVSTFFLFYQLYNYREFPKFKSSYNVLEGDAKNTKYYKMIEKQYQ